MRLARHVLYGEHLDAHRLEGPGGHVPARAVALDLDVHAPHALVHRLVRYALGRHLGRVRGTLAATPEAQRASRLPGYDVALGVGDRDYGVVEGALYVHQAGRDVPANPPARAGSSPALLTLPAHLPLLPPAYGRLRSLALAGVGLGPLPAHGEASAVPDAPVGPDVYEPPDVLVHLAFCQVAHLRVRVHAGLGQDLLRR